MEDIVQCLIEAFSNYYVKLPKDTDYWKTKFLSARVDMEPCFGIFKANKLIGFIIHGVDVHHQELTTLNAGAGVIGNY